ncbi:precorrin-3B C(17)-methyltransferase [Treponema primitia ZAS-2]|uniref:Precorrin-3B C(17)-methyltransferase n=1 Tax=Treponema primitia (strain ATCC BAA-887 / DSM 12427 / ZAS-2) TaxID=545694 RepID=F5YLB8_TREPZ|nr:precorrin-3B C(17)-methyltransferase [Treponema primitia]AEF85143.1 precorrin-3B C(17)-methyltransferase [Treponema primitia ZAS-2]
MGKLIIAGIGPGGEDHMTAACRDALEGADIIAGYTGYTALVKHLYPQKSYLETPMTGETERCREALKLAEGDRRVCLISSGDSGIYGMASLVFELAADYPAASIEVIPGVTAASSGGALLGAPLGHDFAVISLSDLLTPWEIIEKRLRMAAEGDFVICLYNPGSAGRPDHLRTACDILLETLPPGRVCGLARNIGRSGESSITTMLEDLGKTEVDMFTTVFIGSSRTRVVSGKMLTPRGYRNA